MKTVALIDCEQRPRSVTNHYYSASMTEPIGLLYIEAFLLSHGVATSLYRLPLDEAEWNAIAKTDVVGVSGLTHSWPTMLSTARNVKTRNPSTLVVAGREHATCAPQIVLKHPEVDMVITGEGELGLLALAEGKAIRETPGAVCRAGHGRLASYPRGRRLSEADVFPLKRRSEWMVNMFQETAARFPQQAGLVMGRGCVFRCVFCTAPAMWNGYTNQGIANAVDEIVRTHEQYGTNYFAMHDLMLNVNRPLIESFCRELIKQDLNVSLFGLLSATSATMDMELMREAGFHEFGIGIEIPGPERLELGKRFSFDTVRSFFGHVSESGVFTKGYTIIGWPWDQDEDEVVERYVSALRTIPVNNLRVSFVTPFPGTEVFDEYRSNIPFDLTDDAFSRFTTMEPILNFGLSAKKLLRVRERILRGYLSSPEYGQLLVRQSRLPIIDDMNSAMHEWARESGLIIA